MQRYVVFCDKTRQAPHLNQQFARINQTTTQAPKQDHCPQQPILLQTQCCNVSPQQHSSLYITFHLSAATRSENLNRFCSKSHLHFSDVLHLEVVNHTVDAILQLSLLRIHLSTKSHNLTHCSFSAAQVCSPTKDTNDVNTTQKYPNAADRATHNIWVQL